MPFYTNELRSLSVCSIWSHLVHKVRQEVRQSGKWAGTNHAAAHTVFPLSCFPAFSAFFPVINPLILYSDRDILEITNWQCTLQPTPPSFGCLPNKELLEVQYRLHSFFGSPLFFPFFLQTCVVPMSGRSGPECVRLISLSLQLSCCLLSNSPPQGSLEASAKNVITLFNSPLHSTSQHLCFSM